LINHEITYDIVMKKHLRHRCPPLKGQKGQWPHHASILRRFCAYYSTRTLFTRSCRLYNVSP